jgi:hypothetical protein
MGALCCCWKQKRPREITSIPISCIKNKPQNNQDVQHLKLNLYGLQYQLALKIPHGTRFQRFRGQDQKVKFEDDVNKWLSSLFQDKYTYWILYNDEPPTEEDLSERGTPQSYPQSPKSPSHSSYGHSKGVLAWNENKVSWLIHSAPKFPIRFNNGNLEPLQHTETMYGQSFLFLDSISLDILPAILLQMQIIHPCVYETTYHWNQEKLILPAIQQIHLGGGFYHIAKSKVWNQDLYEYLQHTFKGRWKCETWVKDYCIQGLSLADSKSVEWKLMESNDRVVYKSIQDHSKYAVNDIHHVFVGDINRMTSHYRRGGGGVVFVDAFINRTIYSALVEE